MLDKHYEHTAIEDKWYSAWVAAGLFGSQPDPDRPHFTMVIPPPNVTGILHMGHVLNNTIQDILARHKRMLGFNVCWVPGTDHAGIATQTVVEKHLLAEGIEPGDLSREEFLERVWAWKEKFGGIITRQLRRLGSSCDWDRERFTMEEDLYGAVMEAFKRLYEKGWIYRGSYIVNWCPALQTALSDDEVDRSDEASHLWYFRYPLSDGSGHLTVATTRPETMLGDTAVAVHPEDERYRHLIGKRLRLPLVGREIAIIGDAHVEQAFGTGCVKVTPAHDKNDFEMGQTHGLESIIVMDRRARMNENVPERFRGLTRYQAREAIVAEMKALNLLDRIEDHTVAVGRCYRTKDVIEPYLSEQWFVKMDGLAKMALEPVEDGRIRFYPDRWVNTYRHWLTNIRDWCISRQLKWGHRIPVWYCDLCRHEFCAIEAPAECPQCRSDKLRQDPDVLDTWASSWLWPFSVFGWPRKTPDLEFYYPTQTLVTAADIIFFWVARMIMAGREFMGEIPFSQVYFNGIVRDMQGRKMSKSLGNSTDPLQIMDQYGADALRFSIVYNTPFGEDTRFADESCELGKGFCTKIWNANRFLQMTFEDVKPSEHWRQNEPDIVGRWILSRLAATVRDMNEDFEQFRLANGASRIYNFFWGEFCDWYVEFLKPAQRAADLAEREILLGRTVYILDACLRLLHPFMPFVTEELWHHLEARGEGAFLAATTWPQPDPAWIDPEIDTAMDTLQQLISGIRAVRKSHSLANKAPLRLFLFGTPEQAETIGQIESILVAMGGLETYEFLTEDNPPQGCTNIAIRGLSAYLDLSGQLDVEAELAKLDQKVAKLDKELKPLEARLQNEKFMSNAPEAVVLKVRADYEELKRQVENLNQTRADLEKLGPS